MITEERFQKMTNVQWIFHYLETVAEEKEQVKYEINLVKALFSVIKNNSEMIAAYTNPKIYAKVNQDIQNNKMFKSDEIDKKEEENVASVPTDEEREIMDKYNSFLAQFPEELVVENITANKLLRKITREEILRRASLGINKKKE